MINWIRNNLFSMKENEQQESYCIKLKNNKCTEHIILEPNDSKLLCFYQLKYININIAQAVELRNWLNSIIEPRNE